MTNYKPTIPVPWTKEGLDYLRANFTPPDNRRMEWDGIAFEPSFGAIHVTKLEDVCPQLGVPFSELPMCL